MQTIIYHNPRCSKSRAALALLIARRIPHRVIEFLNTPPDCETLHAIVAALGGDIHKILRISEAPYTELGLANASDAALYAALLAHPVLLERPLVVHDGRVAIGRPPENVLALFESSTR